MSVLVKTKIWMIAEYALVVIMETVMVMVFVMLRIVLLLVK